jgi:hypothetical protein
MRANGDDRMHEQFDLGRFQRTPPDEIAEVGMGLGGGGFQHLALGRTDANAYGWILSDPMAGDLGRNGVDFRALKQRPVTVYVILPAERLREHSIWLRLVITSALRSLYSPRGVPVLFMLDEFAQLGHLGPPGRPACQARRVQVSVSISLSSTRARSSAIRALAISRLAVCLLFPARARKLSSISSE